MKVLKFPDKMPKRLVEDYSLKKKSYTSSPSVEVRQTDGLVHKLTLILLFVISANLGILFAASVGG